MGLTFYTSVAKQSKLKVRKSCELIFTFLEVTGEKLIGRFLGPPPSWIGLKNPLSDMISCSFSTQLITSDIRVRSWPRINSLNINSVPIGEIPTKDSPVCVCYIIWESHCTKIIVDTLLKLIVLYIRIDESVWHPNTEPKFFRRRFVKRLRPAEKFIFQIM